MMLKLSRRLFAMAPPVPRRVDLSPLTPLHLNNLSNLLNDPAAILHSQKEDLSGYTSDWMGKYAPTGTPAPAVLRPANLSQLSDILKYCNTHKIAVVPQGGNTGLVGGSVPVYDEVVLSLSRMNKIISFDEHSGVLVCEAGVVLENAQNFLDSKGFIFPLDLGAKGSCMVGGNVATNAGGLRLVKYGSLHGSVLGLEAVMANGEVFDGLSTLRKDNTGYDLKQLFIGSEGTLGVITKIAILAPHKPKGTQVAFLALKSYADVLETMKRAKHELSDLLSAIEFADRQSVDRVFHHFADLPNPLADQYPFYMLLELSSNNLEQDSERINSFLMNCIEKEMVLDGTIAQDLGQAQNLWKIREGIPESLSKSGLVFKYDVSVPVSEMYDLVNVLRERLSTKLSFPQDRVTGYGHLGDGNLHLNIWQPRNEDSKSLEQAIEPFVFEEVKKRAGSISAEHGLGLQKAQHIHYSKSATQIKIMKQIKNMFDPNGILNPYKVLPDK